MAADLSGHAGADGADAGCAGEEELAGQWKSSKRRLTGKEVRVLELNFVTQGPRLEQETKLRLARELALQPRQVAIWFQNRRARWKGKQLEKDFLLLKAEYLAFKDKYNALLDEKEKLAEEVKRLKKGEADKSSPECKENVMPEWSAYNMDVDDFPVLELGPAYPELGSLGLDFISASHVDSCRTASSSSSCCCGVPSSDSIGLFGPDSGQTSQLCCCSLFEGMNVMNLLASPPQNGTQICGSPNNIKVDSAALSQQGMDPLWAMKWPSP